MAHIPKTGSTFFIHVLQKILCFPFSSLTWGYYHHEQNLHYSQFIKYSKESHISRASCKAGDVNLMLLHCFAVKPIILTRKIPDIIISYFNHYEKINNWPQFFAPIGYESFTKSKKLDLIIDHFIPWIIDFLESWINAEDELGYKPLWLDYEDVTKQCKSSCQKVLEYYGFDYDLSLIDSYIQNSKSSKNYFNVGISGRGKQELSDAHIDRIHSFFLHYPHLKQWL